MNDGAMWAPEATVLTSAPAPSLTLLRGNVDGVHGRCVDGWVFDPDDPTRTLTVEIFDRERLLGEAPARLFRADLAAAAIGDGSHSFRFILPLELFDGKDHEISVRVQGRDKTLTGSPRLLSTQPLSSHVAFPALSNITGGDPPLSDVQFTMLRSLHALTDALVVQTKTLQELLQRQQPGPGDNHLRRGRQRSMQSRLCDDRPGAGMRQGRARLHYLLHH